MGIDENSPVKGSEFEADAAGWNFGLGKAERGLGAVFLYAIWAFIFIGLVSTRCPVTRKPWFV